MTQPVIHIVFSPDDQSAALKLWRAVNDLGIGAEFGLERTNLDGSTPAPLISKSVTHLVLIASKSSAKDLFVSRTLDAFIKTHTSKNILPVRASTPPLDDDRNGVLNPLYLYERGSEDGLLHRRSGLTAIVGTLDRDTPETIARKISAHLDTLPRENKKLEAVFARLRVSQAAWGAAVLASVAAITFGVWGYSQQQAADEAALQAHLSRQASRQMLANLDDSLSSEARREVFLRLGEEVFSLTGPDLRALDPEELSRQSGLLHIVGAARKQEGDLQGALEAYQHAADITAHLLEQDPANPARIYDHAQSVFWIGDAALVAGDFDTAETYFEDYAVLADRLVEIDPGNPVYRGEWAYSQSNLGAVSMGRNEREESVVYLENAIAGYQDGLIEAGVVSIRSLANAYGWRAGPLRALGRIEEAIASRARQREIVEALALEDPGNRSHRVSIVSATLAIADMRLDLGQVDQAELEIETISSMIGQLYDELPESRLIRRKFIETELTRAHIELYRGNLTRAQLLHSAASRAYTSGQGVESEDGRRIDLGVFDLLRAKIAFASNAYESALGAALQAASQFEADISEDGTRFRHLGAFSRFYAGEALQALGRQGEAERQWRQALAELVQIEAPRDLRADDVYARVMFRLGETQEARAVARNLSSQGYARPDFIDFWNEPEQQMSVENTQSQEDEDG